MALGLPQISDNGALLEDLIVSNGIGLCVAPDSIEEVVAAVSRMVEQPAQCKKMAEAARQLYLEKYNYDNQFKPTLSALQSLARRE